MSKRKKGYKSKAERDLNNNYIYVEPESLAKFKGSIKSFISKATYKKPVYLKKPKGRTIIHLWWESKDNWFMNHYHQRITKKNRYKDDNNNGWYLEPDMEDIIKLELREGYEMYIKK